MPSTTAPHPARPWLLATAPALVLAAGVGAVAARVRDDAPAEVSFTVFAVMTFGCFLALGAVLLDRTERPEQHEDSIESQWARSASSGAFYDLVVALGVVTFLTALLDAGHVPLWPFVVLGLGDLSVRLVVLQRREG
ncbi:hypothetical protein NOK12_01610 [Nocardioides sp. OK12]|uniref:Ni/Fe-hydrogenase subunit HybB-like protein n=1 Tax=Nocardioides marinisabuli TaxID=419476 RepID=A0A7Y9JQD6_9ACTN|nr:MULTISPECIES: hypothetical protein [Nocardioides]NYD57967.1 Ni/Fe-hydrogenase subunit HybB-like protein [Nocardioides marinisabuli]GHJ57642.1 hypothetical protein NOK12_01610 [Nocardioides sp. OK12]